MSDFNAMTHGERVRRLAELGRDEGGTAELHRLLDELSRRSGYEYCLTLVAAVAARDVARVSGGLTHDSVRVRGLASAKLLQVGAGDGVLGGVLVDGSAEERGRLSRVVVKGRRTDLAERMIEGVRARRGDVEAARLIGACGDETVRRLLPDLDHCIASWASLARRHPEAVLDHLESSLREASPRLRNALWTEMGPGVAQASRSHPERVLDLVDQLGPDSVIPHSLEPELGRLTRMAPGKIASLLLRPGYRQTLQRQGAPRGAAKHARQLSEADRNALALALRDNEAQLARLMRRIPPSEREAIFRSAFADVDTAQKVWTAPLLEQLPHAVRHEEARRILELRSVKASPVQSLAYSAFLPIDEVRAAIVEQIGKPKAEDRSLGYQLLIACAGRTRDPDEVGRLLETLGRLRNEQDPVRLAAAQALASVPASLVTNAHVGALEALVANVVEARNTSSATLNSVRQFLLRLLEAHAGEPDDRVFPSVLGALDRLAGPTGTIAFGRLDLTLRKGAEHRLLAALLPRMRRDAEHDRFELAMSLAAALGKRAWGLPDLQLLIERATRAPNDSVVRKAVQLYLAAPATRADRAQQLFRRDPSTVTLEPVLSAIAWRCQYLLDTVFDRKPLRGRFLSGKVRYVPLIRRAAVTWLPRQVDAYADALTALIDDPATKTGATASAIRVLATLPGVGAKRIARYATGGDVIRMEAALAGLAWTDTPQAALPLLLSQGGSDRARVAMYAATRCARFIPSAELGGTLEAAVAAADGKITSQKELIRLLGQHRTPQALPMLVAISGQSDKHRDVRIAAGRAVRGFLDEEAAWSALEALLSSGPHEARSLLETVPSEIAKRHRSRFGELVIEVASQPDQLVRQEAFGCLALWAAWSPDAAGAAASCVADLDSGPAWKAAAGSLVYMFGDGLAAEATVGLVARLASQRDPENWDAGADRDLPSRQRLASVLDRLVAMSSAERRRQLADLERCADGLMPEVTLVPRETRLRLAGIDWSAPARVFRIIGLRLSGHPIIGHSAATLVGEALRRDAGAWRAADLEETCDELIAGPEPNTALLALAIIAVAGERAGWSEPWRSRLRRLRAHVEPDVAGVAQGVVCAAE